VKSILVIRIKAIGDVIFTLPAVHALRAHYPKARITFLVSKENAPLLQGFREVDEVIALDRAALRSGNPLQMGREFFGLLQRLRAGKFSLVVDFQGFGETAWLARLSGAPHRWGSVYGRGRSWAYTRGIRRDETLHPADWNLRMLSECGVPIGAIKNEFALPAAALADARASLKENKIDDQGPILVIQPFTSSPQKNWPLENYLAVARHWRERGVRIIFVGGPADGLHLEPARAADFCVLTTLPLLVSAGLVQLSTLMLGGDTGLGHLGVALGRNVRLLMIHNRPGACVPFQHPEWAIVPVTSGGIRGITIDTVLAETEQALGAAS
jgi:ADP-heptose:LPS heptosyltransferase